MVKTGWVLLSLAMSVALACAPLEAAAAAFDGAALALLRSQSMRFVLAETVEGAAFSERFIGRRAITEADLDALSAALGANADPALAERLARSLARISKQQGEEWLRNAAREELGFIAAGNAASPKGFAARAHGFRAGLPAVSAPWPATTLKVAAVQYPVLGGRSFDEVRAQMTAYVSRAKRAGAGLVVFPELFVLDRVDLASGITEADQLAAIARAETPAYFAHVARLSREQGVAVLGGSFPRETPEGIVNTAILAFPDGRIIHQDKLNLTPDEAHWGWKPGRELHVFDAPWGRATILICYDSQFPAVSAALGEAAPETILVPSMTGAKGFQRVRWASQSRAVEHHAYVVVTGVVDAPGGPFKFVAQAAMLTPQDEGFTGVLRQGTLNRGGMVYAELDLAKLRESRRTAGVYAARDEGRRLFPIQVVNSSTP